MWLSPSCWRKQTDPVFPRTGRSNASRCRRCLQPAAGRKHKREGRPIQIKHSSATETPKLGLFCASKPNWTSERISQTYSAWVALQKFDFLIEFDVVRSKAVQFILQGLHGLLHGATLLQASEGTKGRGISPPAKETHEYTCVCARAYVCVTHSFQLLVARAEPLPLAGDDGEQRVHLALRKLRLGAHTWTCR